MSQRKSEEHARKNHKEDPEDVIRALGDPGLDPYEINFLPQYRRGNKPMGAFINSYGVVIGDHEYESPTSPLERWSKETDPFIMTGSEWIHPYKDIGFRTAENRDRFEQGKAGKSGIFMHPTVDAAYKDQQQDEK
jgi:hypothetical protein